MKIREYIVKFLCAFLTSVILLGIIPFTDIAALKLDNEQNGISAKALYSGEIIPCAFPESVDVDALKAYLTEQLEKQSDTISISQFKIPKTEEGLSALSSLLFCDIPTAFHLEYYTYYALSFVDYVIYINPVYRYDADTYAAMLAEIDASAEKMVSDLKDNTNLTDVQKALLAHDRLANFCEYTSYEDETSEDYSRSHCIYGGLVTGKAVCQGYALAYTYLLQKLDIPVYACHSPELNHVWNIVYVNGNYYHVDVTWDDPLWAFNGQVHHDYFLVSTEYMMTNGHSASDYDTTPTDTSYENHFWRNSRTSFQVVGDTVYYYDSVNRTLNNYDGEVLLTEDDMWIDNPASSWDDNFTALATDGEVLFYSTPKSICYYDLSNNKLNKVYKADLSMGETFYIYGMSYSDGRFTIDINNTPIFYGDLKQRLVVEYSFSNSGIVGDVDGDCLLSVNDYIIIRLHCSYLSPLDEDMIQSADVNNDGMISIADYITVKMLLKQ